ncbi:MAG TPA: glycosyltransferase [Tepidisphaeraceae bacterium]|nr:glycosyltransferase [Tepidisphaeraceae bacterium]
MARILLLHDAVPDYQTSRAAEAVAARPGAFEIATRTIGTGGTHRATLSAAWRLHKPAREFDLAHALGGRALVAASLAGFRHIVHTPTEFPSQKRIGWLRALALYRDLRIVCPTATMHRALVTAGLPEDRCHLVQPGVDFSRVRAKRDAALRAALGFDDSHHVLLAPGESTRAAGHDQVAWAAAILDVLDKKTRLLLWGRGGRAPSIAQFARKINQPALVTLAEQRLGRRVEFEELPGVADAAVVAPTEPAPTLPIAVCMAAGLPIAATVTPTVSELLEDRHTALMTQPAVPRLLARRILDLRDDAQLRWKLTDTARAEAYEFYPQTRFVKEMQGVYELALSAPGAARRRENEQAQTR